MEKLNLSAPWVIFYKEIEALFKEDPEVKTAFDEDANAITLYVDNEEKADALSQLLPTERTFGNVTVGVKVVPGNNLAASRLGLFQAAFKGNPAFAYAKTVEEALGFTRSFVVFKREVVQFFADNLKDVAGNCSTLYQDIAADIFGEDAGFSFCTEPGATQEGQA